MSLSHQYTVLIEQDEDGLFVATVPELRSCYTQAATRDALMPRVREVIELCLEEQGEPLERRRFVAIEQVEIAV